MLRMRARVVVWVSSPLTITLIPSCRGRCSCCRCYCCCYCLCLLSLLSFRHCRCPYHRRRHCRHCCGRHRRHHGDAPVELRRCLHHHRRSPGRRDHQPPWTESQPCIVADLLFHQILCRTVTLPVTCLSRFPNEHRKFCSYLPTIQ